MFIRYVGSRGPYLITALRHGGEPCQLHLGKADDATIQLIERAKRERQRRRDESEQRKAVDGAVRDQWEAVQAAVAERLAEVGFYNDRSRGWRKRRKFRTPRRPNNEAATNQ
jgi:hypothetical protein